MRRRCAALALALTVAAGGCGSAKNRLFGSVDEVYDLSFNSVNLQTVSGFLVVEYVQASGAKVAKLSANLSDVTVKGGQPIDLTTMVGSQPRGTLQRVQQTTIQLPIQQGTLTLDEPVTAGANLSGQFRTTLSDPMGRTLNGDFSATVVAPPL